MTHSLKSNKIKVASFTLNKLLQLRKNIENKQKTRIKLNTLLYYKRHMFQRNQKRLKRLRRKRAKRKPPKLKDAWQIFSTN